MPDDAVELVKIVGWRSRYNGLLWVECPYCGVQGLVTGPGTASCGYCESNFDVIAA